MQRSYRSSRYFSIVSSIVYHAKPVKFVWFIVEVVFSKIFKVVCSLHLANWIKKHCIFNRYT